MTLNLRWQVRESMETGDGFTIQVAIPYATASCAVSSSLYRCLILDGGLTSQSL